MYQTLLASSQVQRVYLDELGDPVNQSTGVSLVQLVVERPERVAAQARQLLKRANQKLSAGLSQEAMIELIETIVVYKFPHLSRQEVETMLGLSELKHSRVYQEALQEGRQEGGIALILRQLTRRLGGVAPELQAQIQVLPLTQLEALGEALLDFSDAADLVSWLQTHQGLSP